MDGLDGILSMVTKYGTPGLIVGVVVYVVLPVLARRVRPKTGPAAPAVPELPADPVARPKYPVIHAVLKAMYPLANLTPETVKPELMGKLRAEVEDWHLERRL